MQVDRKRGYLNLKENSLSPFWYYPSGITRDQLFTLCSAVLLRGIGPMHGKRVKTS